MHNRFTVPLPAKAQRPCVVCAEPLDRGAALTARQDELHALCREPACRTLFAEVAALPDAEFRRQLAWRGEHWRTWRARLVQARAEDTRLRRERTEAEAREAAAAFAAIAPLAELKLTVFSGRGPSRPLPERRRRAYAAHLDAVIAAALEPSAKPVASGEDPGASASTLPARLCGACGGGCCPLGGTRAFLEEATIRRVMAADPGLDAAGVRALYLDHLPPRPVAGSCVNHTRHGCALPRSLRADTCNRWACLPLQALQQGLESDPPVRTVAVLSRRQNHWNQDNLARDNAIEGAAVLSETETRRRRPPKPRG
jgi:hypothetical protein